MNHVGKRFFITGIPTGGKSYLAKGLAEKTGAIVVSADDLREVMHDDPRYNKWVNFYLNQNEKSYYTTTTPEQQWENLVAQSEGIWPYILEKIDSYQDETKLVIFEGVNILPHLANRDLSFQGVVMVGKSFEDTIKRIKENNRWGNTEELWNLEADSFF